MPIMRVVGEKLDYFFLFVRNTTSGISSSLKTNCIHVDTVHNILNGHYLFETTVDFLPYVLLFEGDVVLLQKGGEPGTEIYLVRHA